MDSKGETPTILRLRDALERSPIRRLPGAKLMRKAAVAAVLREGVVSDGAELLLIRRAENPRDPWSGHMAFPGGRVEKSERTRDAALRETREEIGLDLTVHGTPLGRLSPVATMGRGAPVPMVIHPYVYALSATEPALTLNEEVAAVVWVPLRFLLDRRRRETMEWKVAGAISLTMPCYRWDGNVLWGLTLKMVDELLGL